MPPRFRFAPVSGESSLPASLAGGYFVVSGAVTILVIAITLLGVRFGWRAFDDVPIAPLSVTLGALVAAGWLWTGRLLLRRERRGGALALAFLLLPPALDLAQRRPVGAPSLVFTVVGVAVIALAWRDLK